MSGCMDGRWMNRWTNHRRVEIKFAALLFLVVSHESWSLHLKTCTCHFPPISISGRKLCNSKLFVTGTVLSPRYEYLSFF